MFLSLPMGQELLVYGLLLSGIYFTSSKGIIIAVIHASSQWQQEYPFFSSDGSCLSFLLPDTSCFRYLLVIIGCH
ncbi:MAG: hypothetical protein NZ901_00795 [Geminocystis sp.]|nr:hypothetical protein [Geminocystis sp.]HIK37552.1 hypothetical protein [Geminocystis sp. M7585_C2015_104]MCS7146706.1 hypothetical protein [Geminocystis sp.]MCX8077144.1 hypothetical protein [Geminocystis sp.]MDW8115532.1 hypothetical protein [Geminocystis sp.]